MEEEYNSAAEATYARRLGRLLHEKGVLSEIDVTMLDYPSWDEPEMAKIQQP